MKTCKTCRHYRHINFPPGPVPKEWNHLCKAPQNLKIDLVTGEETYKFDRSAYYLRREDSLCGESGAWWLEK